jgi:hypothetical protein
MLGDLILIGIMIFILFALFTSKEDKINLEFREEQISKMSIKNDQYEQVEDRDELYYIDYDLPDITDYSTSDSKYIENEPTIEYDNIGNDNEIHQIYHSNEIMGEGVNQSLEGFENKKNRNRNQCNRCNIENHPNIHKYILKNRIPSCPTIPDMTHYVKKSMLKSREDKKREINKMRNSKMRNSKKGKIENFSKKRNNDIANIRKLDIRDNKIREELEKRFYESKQVDYHNLI